MKRLIIAATAGFVALSGASFAATVDNVFESDLSAYAPNVDASTLTEAQVNAIKLAISSGDSANEVSSYIYSIVNG